MHPVGDSDFYRNRTVPVEERKGIPLDQVPTYQTQSRVVVVSHVCFGPPNAEGTTTTTTFTRFLEGDEQPYIRQYKVTEQWRPLDLGWLEDDAGNSLAGIVTIQNTEGQYLSVHPSEAEKKAIAERIVEIGVDYPQGVVAFTEIPPGEGWSISTIPGVTYVARCAEGPAKITLTALPR